MSLNSSPKLTTVAGGEVDGRGIQEDSETSTRNSNGLSDGRQSGFCYQLGISVKRIVLQLLRDPVTLCVEVFIPILFVIGSIVIWAVLANDPYSAEEYYSASSLSESTTLFSDLAGYLCYNNDRIPGIAPCTDLSSAVQDTLLCGKETTGTPTGLCALPTALPLATEGWKRVAGKSSAYMPQLTELILLKWIGRIMYDYFDLGFVMLYSSDASLYYSTGTLYFAPASDATTKLVEYLEASSPLFKYVYGGTNDTVKGAEDLVKQRSSNDPPIWGIIQVNSLAEEAFDVQIRLNNSAVPSTSSKLQLNYVGGAPSDGTQGYVLSGFSELQKIIYEYYLKEVSGVDAPPTAVATMPMPTMAYKSQSFLASAGSFVPMIIVFGFLYPVSQMTKRAVMEKELRLREAMLIMGLSHVVMYLSYFIVYLVQYTMVTLVASILLKVTYARDCNFGVLFFLFFAFCLSLIALSGLISSCFSKSRLAGLLAPLIYFALAIPVFAMNNASGAAKSGVTILSPSGFSIALQLVFEHELAGGFTTKDMTNYNDMPNMLVLLVMLFIDFFLYVLLMVYLDLVLPKDWGTRKHPLFCIIDPIKACCCRGGVKEANAEDGRAVDGVFEEATNPESSAIQICGLRKEFGSGKKKFVAVNNLYLNMKEGEITVLLGHNGAGKTTTMNMMTGMIEADGGDCLIYGKSVTHDLDGARQEIGYCPQHNILWPNLTCREHLWYYASIKGLRGTGREEAIVRMLHGVDLADKADYRAAALSGGQKRKLSVAIAFVGQSKLVFLDEPTAGMDATARRHTWQMLRQLSRFHSILLTTHFMDEADLLGDTVAIMSKGRLQCCGSNMFLKSKLGVGYVLTMSVVAHTPREPIAAMVRSFVPEAEPLGCGGGEVAFRLPMQSKNVFPELLERVESGSQLGINGFSISATTLEEIFIKIAEADEPVQPKGTQHSPDFDVIPGSSSVWNVSLMESTTAILWSQFKAMMIKRFWNSLRDRRTQFFQIVCPVVCVLLAMLLSLLKFFDLGTTTLNSDIYGSNVLVDVAGCDGHMNYDIPFARRATTTSNPDGATTAEGLTEYLSKTYYNHPNGKPRYLGLVCEDTINAVSSAFVMYNASSTIEIPIGMYNLYNGYYQKAVGSSYELYTTSKAMPQTKAEQQMADSIYAMMIAMVIMIPFTFIPSTFVSWIVKEKQSKARHLQNASGLSFYVYWLSNFLFDACCYLITMMLVIFIFLIFNRKEYIGASAFGGTFLVLLLYGLSGITMAYALSFLFDDYASAQNVVMLGNFITGFLLVMVIVMLKLIPSTTSASNALRWAFRIVPSFCVGEGIMNLALVKLENTFGGKQTALSMSVTGWPCVYMAIEFPLYALIVLFIDHPGRRQRSQRLFHNPDAPPEVIPDEDPDVSAEAMELETRDRLNDLVTVKNLRKVYGNGKVAVRNVTFGVKTGEVFGFLGTNGAGKTTTISILCQEFFPTSGHAKICGYDIVEESSKALRCVGYCPQFDATLELLTVEEHLYLYAGVRGIGYEDRKRVVEGLMILCELTNYRDKKSMDLSGGNRRKLSVALSLIGGPRVVFLDEPSAGMDPVARRGLWTAIQTVADNCAVVLTTHHLEEVEALAHRVAIMVDGALKCIGNKTHLKTKYGSGFELTARLADDSEQTRQDVELFITSNFPGCALREFRARRLIYELPGSTKLSETFRVLEQNSERLRIADYSVAQTSIEQVFLRISEEAELQREREEQAEDKKESGCCSCC